MKTLKTIEHAPEIREGDLDAFQAKYGIALPASYRRFLLETNGGRPERDLFPVPDFPENPVARIHFFFGLNDSRKSYDLGWNRVVHSDRLPPDVIAIATTEGADMVCLRLDDRGSGEVLYWDDAGGTLLPVVDQFEQFLLRLSSDDLSPSSEP